MRKTEHNFWLDVTIFVAFLTTTMTGFLLWLVIPHRSGLLFLRSSRSVWLSAHVSCALVVLASIVMHVVRHWDWLKALRRRPLGALQGKVRANRIVNRIMWIVFISTTVFGAMAWAFDSQDDHYYVSVPDRLHVAFGVALLVIATVHLALHWKWIALTARRCLQMKGGEMVLIPPATVRD